MSIEFWVTSLIVVLIPGTGVIYTISCGITGGLKKSIWAAIGCTLGIVPHMVASIVGLSALLNASALAFSVLKYVGVAYLLFLAWQMWHDKTNLGQVENAKESTGFSTLRRAVLMNLLNPKLTIFFLSFLPQFVSKTGDATAQLLFLSACFMLLTLAVFLVYGALAHTFRELFLHSPRLMKTVNRSFAAVLAYFGVQLAVTEK